MKLCIFDLDGTLLNTLVSIAYYGNRALKAFGLAEIDDYRMLVGDGRDTLIRRMLAADGADEGLFERVRAVYDEGYEGDPLYLTEPYQGIEELLDALKAHGVSLAVCSNKPDNVVCGVVSAFFKAGTFNTVAGQVDSVPKKPAPDAVYRIMDALGAKKEDVLFIGDTNVDIFTAANAGVRSCGVLWGFRDRDELVSAGADFIAEKPEDILKFI